MTTSGVRSILGGHPRVVKRAPGRPEPVLGRKHHDGSRSQRGTEVAAPVFGLIESAKPCGVEPTAYLRRALRAVLADPETVTLPHALSN